jgi:hypothetical protein
MVREALAKARWREIDLATESVSLCALRKS